MESTATDQDPEKVDVLGVRISAVTMHEALERIDGWICHGERRYVCVTGVHGVMECQHDAELMRIHNSSGLTVPDGAPILWAGRAAGAKQMGRIRGPDLLPAVCRLAAERGWSSYFYGGAAGTPELLASRLSASIPGLAVAGTYSPPFRELTEAENREVVERINASGADIVWVGLSTPKQERWIARNRGALTAPVLCGVGAAFDVHAGLIQQAPQWMRPLGLEWAFRLAHDPARLWRRYLRNNPHFVAQILRRPPRQCRNGDEGGGP